MTAGPTAAFFKGTKDFPHHTRSSRTAGENGSSMDAGDIVMRSSCLPPPLNEQRVFGLCFRSPASGSF